MEIKGDVDDILAKVADIAFEVFEVPIEEGEIDAIEGVFFRSRNISDPEMSLVSGIDEEGASGVVHGSQVLAFRNEFEAPIGSIVPMLVVSMLAEQFDGILSIVLVELLHIEIVDEDDKF